ncbi:T9SS type A sorting domain-containing protein [Paraflavitalea sp. CAU 1676]|uniref:T9SS type A sorting domain-containing protein n=1 Tax=Paraflavitalea sp. CAU 1676 TaxID=3032598 RepID=UPI0023DB8F71|nr:T9SS type A sorting domain-containing protein [Paraflavitalea sp. CAU 1676]MDF2192215.1 T9SS type A sorting domain-containing protein [Paraflavitalea sp. CAU 1676]
MYPNCTYDFKIRIVSWRDWISRITGLTCIILAASMLMPSAATAQCHYPSMTFVSPKLMSGTARQVGAVYKFSNVTTGVDATIQIMALVGGAGLNDMDNTSQGYYDAWQPYVTAGASGTSYLDWKIVFKKAGTNTDTILPCLSITAIDIDGDGSKLKEFIVASTPGAYAVDPNTLLNVSFDGVNSHAIGTVLTVPNIDTNATKYMFQMNFTNVGTIIYRNGSISTKTSSDVRHTCIYFKSFFESGLITLPVQITSFTGKMVSEGVNLNWVVSNEQDIQHFAVQRSPDGSNWENVGKTEAEEGVRSYHYMDKSGATGKAYYRLVQVATGGSVGFSRIIAMNQPGGLLSINMPTLVSRQIPINLDAPAAENYQFAVYNGQGVLLTRKTFAVQTGLNSLQLDLPASRAAGIYMIAIRNGKGEIVERKRILVQ